MEPESTRALSDQSSSPLPAGPVPIPAGSDINDPNRSKQQAAATELAKERAYPAVARSAAAPAEPQKVPPIHTAGKPAPPLGYNPIEFAKPMQPERSHLEAVQEEAASEQGVPVPPKQHAMPPKAKHGDRPDAKPIDQQLKDRIAANRKAAERYIELHRKTDKELRADEEAKELEPGVAENLPESYHNAPVGPNSPEHKTAKDYNSTH